MTFSVAFLARCARQRHRFVQVRMGGDMSIIYLIFL